MVDAAAPTTRWKPLMGRVLALLAAISTLGLPVQSQETNPSGDIPDTQVFVTYRSAVDGYKIDVPEGWARTTRPHGVRFTNRLNAVSVSLEAESQPPKPDELRARLIASGARDVRVRQVRSLRLPAGTATLIRFTSRSQTDPVTDRSLPLANDAYFIYHKLRLARIELSGPVAADNADQWQRIVKSFRWT